MTLKVKFFSTLFLVFVLFTEATAQDIFKVHQTWIDMTVWYRLNDKMKVGGDFGYRTALDQVTFHTVYFRPSFRWKVSPSTTLGLMISNHQTFNSDIIDLNELRFAQQVQVTWPNNKKINLKHRVRMEERFYFIDQGKENESRVRYRLALIPATFNLFNTSTPFYAHISWEAFIKLGASYEDPIGNAHRWEIMLGNKLSKKVKISLNYFWQTARTVDDLFLLQENIFRLRIMYTINN
jgi:hypothetical protein